MNCFLTFNCLRSKKEFDNLCKNVPSAPNGGGFPLRGLTPRGFAASLLLFLFALRVLSCGVRRRRRRLTARWAEGASRVLFGFVAAVALGVFFGLWSFVNALNCVSYGEPDVRPAGRPDGRVRGLALCVGGIRCGLFRAG